MTDEQARAGLEYPDMEVFEVSNGDHIERVYRAIEFAHDHGQNPDPAFVQTFYYVGAMELQEELEKMTGLEQVAALAKWSELNCAYAVGASYPRVSAT